MTVTDKVRHGRELGRIAGRVAEMRLLDEIAAEIKASERRK